MQEKKREKQGMKATYSERTNVGGFFLLAVFSCRKLEFGATIAYSFLFGK